MYDGNKTAAIIPAAGTGSRMNSGISKQYIIIDQIPVLARTLKVFNENKYIDEIILIINENDIEFCQENIINKYNISKIKKIVPGGSERQDSCASGVKSLSKDIVYVLIHDGARPFLTDDIIGSTLKSVKEYGVCCTCIPVKDTIKVVDDEANIIDTPPRRSLYAAQTPQGFKCDILKNIYAKAEYEKYTATDDVQIAEHYGYVPHMVKGSYENIKITTKEDLYMAEGILKGRILHQGSE